MSYHKPDRDTWMLLFAIVIGVFVLTGLTMRACLIEAEAALERREAIDVPAMPLPEPPGTPLQRPAL